MRFSNLRNALLAALTVWGCSQRDDALRPDSPLYQFTQGQAVQTTTTVTVHSAANNFSSSVGTKAINSTGTIVSSPGTLDASGDNTIYWNVAFSGGPTGWVSGVFLAPSSGGTPGTDRYVSPTGSSSNSGTQSSPWSLQWAFDPTNTTLQAGDVVWLLPGTYGPDIDFTADKSGAAGNPIVYRQHSSGHAIVDGRIRVHGNYLTFWGFEVMQSDPLTHDAADWYDVESYGHDLKYINLVIHDASKSGIIVYWPTGPTEIYGCVIYNNGLDNNVDHGIYVQNSSTTGIARIEENVIFDNTSHGIHAYTETNTLRNIQLVRNVSFNNGSTANPTWGYDQRPNLLVGGTIGGATAIQVDSNYIFEQNAGAYEDGPTLQMGFGTETNSDATLRNNTVWGGNAAVYFRTWSTGTVTDNVLRGGPTYNRLVDKAYQGTPLTGYTWTGNHYYATSTSTVWWYNNGWRDLPTWQSSSYTGLANSGTAENLPGTATTYLRTNKYDGSRALLVIYNWQGTGTVSVSLSSFISAGAQYTIRNVYDIYGTPVLQGTYDGNPVSVPMTGKTPPPLSGHGWSATGPTSGPYFNAFIVTTP